MRRAQIAFAFVVFFTVFPVPLFAQQSTSLPPITPQRDPQAVAILQKAVAAAGGLQAVHGISDFEAQGAIKYPGVLNEPTGQVKIQGRGIDQMRMDVQVAEGTRSLVLNHGVGSFKDLNSTAKIPASNGFQIGLLIFPTPIAIAALADPLADIILEGTGEIKAASVYRIKIVRSAPDGVQRGEMLRQLRTSEIFIDSATFMVVAVRHTYYPRETMRIALTREVFFSDYRQVGGVMFPFTITETVGGQHTWNIALSAVDFNKGLTDITFK